MIHLDTNFLIRAIAPGTPEEQRLRALIRAREPLNISAMVWAEFLCGPVTPDQERTVAALFPLPEPILSEDAERAARLFNVAGRRRSSLSDCIIAATCLRHDASLATNNLRDFQRFEPQGLRLIGP